MSQSPTPAGRISGVLFTGTDIPMKAVTVALTGKDIGRIGTTTNNVGVFAFDGVCDGDYTLRVDVVPVGLRVIDPAADGEGYLPVKIQDGQAVELRIGHAPIELTTSESKPA